MTETSKSSFSASGFYRIEVQGRLRKDWSNRLGAMQVSSYVPDGDAEVTVLQGPVQDQPELAGIIKTLYELHLTLRSVRYLGKVPAAI